jgi:hypothetical protein
MAQGGGTWGENVGLSSCFREQGGFEQKAAKITKGSGLVAVWPVSRIENDNEDNDENDFS